MAPIKLKKKKRNKKEKKRGKGDEEEGEKKEKEKGEEEREPTVEEVQHANEVDEAARAYFRRMEDGIIPSLSLPTPLHSLPTPYSPPLSILTPSLFLFLFLFLSS